MQKNVHIPIDVQEEGNEWSVVENKREKQEKVVKEEQVGTAQDDELVVDGQHSGSRISSDLNSICNRSSSHGAATIGAVAGDTGIIGTGAAGVTPGVGDGAAGGGGGTHGTATNKAISAAHGTPSTRGGMEERIDGSGGGGDKGLQQGRSLETDRYWDWS